MEEGGREKDEEDRMVFLFTAPLALVLVVLRVVLVVVVA